MKSLSLLARVFYDRTLSKSFIAEGCGTGVGLLFKLALVLAFFWAIAAYLMVRPVTGKLFDPVLESQDGIAIINGKIEMPVDYEYTHISENGDFFFVFDTTNKPVSLSGLPAKGFYLAKDRLIVVRRHSAASILWAQIFEKSGDVVLKGENAAFAIKRLLLYLHRSLPCFVFAVLTGLFMAAFLVYTFFFTLFSFFLTSSFRLQMPVKMRMRLCVLSFLPFAVLNGVGLFWGVRLNFTIAGIVTLTYMFCFLTEYVRLNAPQKC